MVLRDCLPALLLTNSTGHSNLSKAQFSQKVMGVHKDEDKEYKAQHLARDKWSIKISY